MARAGLGIDYSTKAIHVAGVDTRSLLFCRQYDLSANVSNQVGVILRALREALAGFPEDGKPEALFMERQWARPGANIVTALELHKVPTRIETVGSMLGLPVVYVYPNVWRASVLGNGGYRTDAAKAAAIRYVQTVYGFTAPIHDAAEAICIAAYGLDSSKRAELVRRASSNG